MIATFGALGAALLLGAPVVCDLALTGLIFMVSSAEYPSTLPAAIFNSLNSQTLLAIPFFILAAEILNRSGGTKRLVSMVDAWMGHNQGGLPVVAVVATALF